MNYKDKFNAQMKKAGINSLDDLKTDAEKKAFFKAVDKSHDAKNESVTEELMTMAEDLKEYTGMSVSRSVNSNDVATALRNLKKGTKLYVQGKPQGGQRTMGDVISVSGDTVKIKPTASNGPISVKVKDITMMDTLKEEAINEFKLKDSDVEKLKQGVKQMPPMKGAKLGKPEKVKTAAEEYVEEAMKKEMAKKEMMMKAMKTGEADAEPNAEMLNAMVKDPHKSKEDKPMKDMNAMYMKSDVRADVKNGGGADMAKVKDGPKMQTAMKKINAMYKTEKYLDEKPGSIQNVVAQMQVNEMKTVTIRVKEFSQMVETYLARGGVKGFINAELTEGKQVLPLKEVRAFIDTYNKHFLTNYRAEEFIIRDRLSEAVTGLPKGRALMYIIKTDKNTASRIKSFLADHGERYPIHIDDDDSGQITLDAYDDRDAAHDAAQAISKKFNVTVRGTR